MAWELLPTDYTDRTWNGLQKYTEVDNGDGTVSFLDVTSYTNKEKSFFGARDANRMNEALNTLMSMVEQGTDLYEVFQQYFETQQELFAQEANEKQGKFDDALTALNDTATATLNTFETYITDLRQTADADVQRIKDDYAADIEQYERNQQTVFDAWFQAMRDQLSKDAAGNLQNEIDDLKNTLITIEVDCQDVLEGKGVTCTNGTDTKTVVVGPSHIATFQFGRYGTYTVSDDLTSMPTTFKAYHYGYYPVMLKMGVIQITCPAAMIGHTVTCVQDDVSYEKVVDSDLVVTFGTPTLGIWTITNDFTDEVLRMNVEDYVTYTAEFQIATLTVICDTSYEGETVTVTDGTKAYSQQVPADGEVVFSIPTFGTWTISTTKVTDTKQIAINAYTLYSVTFGVVAVRVVCLDDSFAGQTVTFKKGTDTITETIPATLDFIVNLSGLGTWKCTNSRTAAEITINAEDYRTYDITLSIAALEVSYTEDFIGQDFTVTAVGGTATETKTADSSLKLRFAIDLGKWQVSNTLTATKKVVEATEYTTYSTTFKAEEFACVGSYVGVFTNK